jgi:ADP-ribose pyrophosphatase YjhB (NUDIX family)
MHTPVGPEKIVFEGKMLEVVEQPIDVGGKIVTFEFARRSPGVRLIIPTPTQEILLTREYRKETGGYDYRLPGGKVFDTLKEFQTFRATHTPIQEAARTAAIKEASEEVGITVHDVRMFGMSRCGATIEWDLYYFVVQSYTKDSQNLEHGEDITTLTVAPEEARRMCLDGNIQEERSALMLMRFLAQDRIA